MHVTVQNHHVHFLSMQRLFDYGAVCLVTLLLYSGGMDGEQRKILTPPNSQLLLQTFPYRFISIITYLDPAPQYATHPAPAVYL